MNYVNKIALLLLNKYLEFLEIESSVKDLDPNNREYNTQYFKHLIFLSSIAQLGKG